jgi:hypothetical protein
MAAGPDAWNRGSWIIGVGACNDILEFQGSFVSPQQLTTIAPTYVPKLLILNIKAENETKTLSNFRLNLLLRLFTAKSLVFFNNFSWYKKK